MDFSQDTEFAYHVLLYDFLHFYSNLHICFPFYPLCEVIDDLEDELFSSVRGSRKRSYYIHSLFIE